MTVKDAVEATGLFSSGTTVATTAQKLYTLVIGTTTGALKALRIAIAATGIGLLVVAIGFLIEKLANAKTVTDLVTEAQEKYNTILERTNYLLKQNISNLDYQSKSATLRAKILGKGEEELFEIQQKYSKKQLDLLGENYDKSAKKASDFRKNTKAILLKANEEEAKSINDLQKKLDDDAVKAREAYYAKKEERATSSLEYELSVKDAEREAQAKADEKRKADAEKALQDAQKAREEAEKKRKEFEESVAQGQRDLQIATNEAEFEQNRLKVEEAERVAKRLEEIAQEQTRVEQEEAEKRKLFFEITEKSKVDLTNNTFQLLGAISKKGSALAKAVAIADVIRGQVSSVSKIISNTAEANAKAVALSPLTAGQPFVTLNTVSAGLGIASSVAGALKAIKDINSESQSAGAGGSIGGAGGTPSAPSFNLVQGTGTNQIAQGIANQRQPIQAYVTSGAVTTAQSLERNIIRDASL